MAVQEVIETGNAALTAGDWQRARAIFEGIMRPDAPAEVLDGLGQALWWLNELGPALEYRERAYASFLRAGEQARAAAIAVWLGREHFTVNANMPASSGWLSRAQSLLDEIGDCAEWGWLELMRGATSPDPAAMEQRARAALEFAQRFGDRNLAVDSLSLLGLALVGAGSVRQGMEHLDEAMAAATGGELSSFWAVADVYCNTLLACERASDFERAEQWSRVVDEFACRRGCAPMFPFCHVTFGGLLTATGRWADADRELRLAVAAFQAGHRGLKVLALARLAELRVHQGSVGEAKQLLAGYEEHPLALRAVVRLRLALGDTEWVVGTIQRRLEQVGNDNVLATPWLAMLTDARLRLGDFDEAEVAARQLLKVAGASGQAALIASGHRALGRVLHTAGKGGTRELEAALESYSRLEMPFDAARTRLDLASAMAADQPALARGEAQLALSAFERLGAASDRDEARALLRQLGAHMPPGRRETDRLTRREREVLALIAEGISNADIGGRLFLSRKTVEHHVTSVLAKLGLNSRAEAAAYAVRHGNS